MLSLTHHARINGPMSGVRRRIPPADITISVSEKLSPMHPSLGSWKWNARQKLIKFFCWLLLPNRLNTRNMLRRRHYNVGTTYNCTICNLGTEETVEHLFFHCDFARNCWSLLHMDFPSDTTLTRLSLTALGKNSWNKPMFMEVFATATWSLWKERNNCYFEGIPPTSAA